MVARTPQKQRKVVVTPLNPVLLRETINKVDKCMERLQELQYTVAGGNKVVSGVNLSPRSTRTYLRTSLRCKQETLRIKNSATRKSPVGKFPAASTGDWKRMSLPAMLLGETVGEILQATQFTREIVETVDTTKKSKRSTPEDDPKTPETHKKTLRPKPESTSGDIRSRRKKEKQNKLQLRNSEESHSPSLQRARSRIVFRVVSPPKIAEKEQNKGNGSRYLANRVSPKHKPWAKQTVLFPNPLFLSAPSAQQAKFCRTRCPIIARNNNSDKNNNSKQTPHKFLIKSPPSASKFQVKIKNPPKVSISPTRMGHASKKSPPKLSTASKLRRSLSPARLANRLVSPLKSRKSVQKNDELMSRLMQRPVSVPKRFSHGRI